MSNSRLDHYMYSRPQYAFTLSGLGSDRKAVLLGVMTNEMSISGGNTFTTTGQLTRDLPIAGNVLGAMDQLTGSARKLGGRNFYSKGETTAKWEESQKPAFTIEFTLYSESANMALKHAEAVRIMASACLPRDDNGSLLSPLEYGSKSGDKKHGTIILKVGTWFLASKLVMTNYTATPSKQVMQNGYPLYWTCSFTVEPFQTITYSDFQEYFQSPVVIEGDAVAGQPKKATDLASKLKEGINKFKNLLG